MKKIISKLDNIEEYILIVSLPMMLLLVFASTCVRYLDLGSLTWAEEASRYLMIWAAYAGISLGIKHNDHFSISFFVDKFTGNMKKTLFLVRSGLVFLFAAIVLYYTSIIITNQMVNNQLSPSLGLPIWVVYSSMAFCSTMIILRITIITIRGIKSGIYDASEGGTDT